MIPTTIEILIWMTNASPMPRTWTLSPGSGSIRKLTDRLREVEADGRADGDREDRPEQPGPQLAEMVDERHDRLVAGRGGRRRRVPGRASRDDR